MAKLTNIKRSFNAGELDERMDSRKDQEKYAAGCKTLENFIPLIYGAAQQRTGLEFIAAAKSSTAANKSRLVGFEHSVDDTYILEFANQVIRAFKNGAQVVEGVGTEDISGLDNIVAHWLLNDTEGTNVVDDDGGTHDGTASTDIATLAVEGTVNGAFDLNLQYDVAIPSEGGGVSSDFSFTDNSNDSAFSIACWAFVTQQNDVQVLLSKWRDESTTREWRLSLSNERKLQLHLADTSADFSSLRIAHWLLNESAGNKTVLDEDASNHDGLTQTDNTSVLSAAGATANTDKSFDLGGADAVVITNNDNELSFGNGSDDSPFSIMAWVFLKGGTGSRHILSKYDQTTGSEAREWRLYWTATEHIEFSIYDESANARESKTTSGSISTGWHFIVATYDGTGGTSANDGMILYIDGERASAFKTDSGTYVAMENLATKVIIGGNTATGGSVGNFFDDKIDNVALFNDVLTPAQISVLWNDGAGTESLGGSSPTPFVVANNAIGIGWHFITATYSAPSDETAAAGGIILYIDGVAVASTATNDADYTAMQDGVEEVRIGSQRNTGDSANENFWGDKIDEVSIFSDVLTPTEVASLYSTTPFEIISPYLTADLLDLKFEQSADVMFITHPSYEERKLSRFGDTVWTLEVAALKTGPFRDQNIDTAKTITASGTTGSVTLTATGHQPFVLGTIVGHEPSGSSAVSKSQTGALFKLIHASNTPSVGETLNSTTVNDVTATLSVPKGVTWDFTTNGTWGTGGPSTIVLERSYDNETTYETVHTVTSLANKNTITSGTEETADALYRARVSNGDGTGTAEIQLSIRDTSHIGIVQITSVVSSVEAIGTVVQTLGATDPTHRFSEGSFSNRRGWPIDVTISSEERLTFTGNISEPLTVWGSFIGDFTDFALGTDDDAAIQFTLVGSGQQNRIRWTVAKDAMILGTNGGEHLLGASKNEEALTPTNAKAKLQTTYGSENVAAKIVNQAVLFLQRGGKKIREFLYNFEADAHKADDLTVFAGQVTGDGIVDMAFQRTPDPILWCVRTDGQLAIMNYERDQNVFSWARMFTTDSTANSVIESVAVIYGGTRSEDEVWVSVLRQINSSDSRTIERFAPRELPSSASDWKFLDSYITDTGGDTTIEVPHLIGETVQVLGDGLVQASKVVSGGGTITAATAAAKYQVGLGYTATLVPMDIDLEGLGLAVTTRINKTYVNVHDTVGVKIGPDADHLKDVVTGTEKVTDFRAVSIPGGYARDTTVTVQQTLPLPATILSLTHDIGGSND